jgi:hypothetical protein
MADHSYDKDIANVDIDVQHDAPVSLSRPVISPPPIRMPSLSRLCTYPCATTPPLMSGVSRGSATPYGAVSLPWAFVEAQLIADGVVLQQQQQLWTQGTTQRFTQRLIDILNGLSASREIAVAQIHAKLVNEANQPASIVASSSYCVQGQPLHYPRPSPAV